MKVGLFGPRASGKSTLFAALSGMELPPATGVFETHVAAIPVPDPRIDRLVGIYKPRKTVYAKLDLVDVPGFSPDRDKKVDNKVLEALRDADLLCVVLNGFDTERLFHDGDPDPAAEFDSLLTEMVILDLIGIESKLERLNKTKKTSDGEQDARLFERMKACLEENKPLRTLALDANDLKRATGYAFLTLKPVMVAVNIGEGSVGKEAALVAALVPKLPAGIPVVTVCGTLEREISSLPAEERKGFLAEMGIAEPARDLLVRTAYGLLDLVSFLTYGEDEVRAWTIGRGTGAKEAAGAIHSDLQRGFIKAEVIHFDDFVAAGTAAAAREKKLFRLEGPAYEVKDGDMIEIRFNV